MHIKLYICYQLLLLMGLNQTCRYEEQSKTVSED